MQFRIELADDAIFLQLWNRAKDLIHRNNLEIVKEFSALNLADIRFDLIQDHIIRIDNLKQKVKVNLDKWRLENVKEILKYILDYGQQQSYAERERLANIIQTKVKELESGIEENPTKYSCELYRTYVLSLGKTIEQHFERFQQDTEPEHLLTELATDSYIPNANSEVICQLTISNESGKSPVNAIKIIVQESPRGEYIPKTKVINITEALPGGESISCKVPVEVTDIAKSSQVFVLYYQLYFITRKRNDPDDPVCVKENKSIKLYPEEDFEIITNPYANYAQGKPVTDKKMFFGRDNLIETLIQSISTSYSPKNVVIYGQKRSGKSSILYHLKEGLTFPIIPVRFNAGENILNFSVPSFLRQIINSINITFRGYEKQGYPSISVNIPSIEQLESEPVIEFHNYMFNLKEHLDISEVYRGATIMLLIDEFTYIYGQIKIGQIPETCNCSGGVIKNALHQNGGNQHKN
jgi:hypothetical protein